MQLNLSRFDDQMRLKEHFHWLVAQTFATQVAGQMLHRAMLKKFVAVAVSATGLVTFLVVARYVTLGNDSKLHDKLHNVTAP